MAARHELDAAVRCADALSFSGPNEGAAELLLRVATKILQQEGFELNAAKTQLQRRGGRQPVTGVTVNQRLGLLRQERRN